MPVGVAMPPQNMFVVEAPMQNFAAPDVPVAREEIKDLRGPVAAAKEMKVSGPFAHANLAVFLIHGPDKLKDRPFLTLHEAVAAGQAVVHDRGMVVVENLSPDRELFIQSGDIVKGGNQDRTIEYDHVLAPRSGQIPVAALCVEQGRSFPRGGESAAAFMSAADQLPTRSLRLAALYRRNQAEVWNGVQRTQANLARNVGGSVQAPLSTTSLQLTLESDRVQDVIGRYRQDLEPAFEGKNDVIGIAVVVNGKLHSADVYASNALFEKLWPKLLKAAAIEALSERSGQVQPKLPDAKAVQAFLAAADQGTGNRRDVSGQIRMISQESAGNVRFDTCDLGRQNLVLHRCVLAK
jgi:hypothetical protein